MLFNSVALSAVAVPLVAALAIDKRQSGETDLSGVNRINYTYYGGHEGPVTVDIDLNGPRNQTAPILYGWMFEDISHSGDGGIYAEAIQNRAFQGSTRENPSDPDFPFGPTLDGYYPVGNVSLRLSRMQPLSDALPVVLEVEIGALAEGEVGFFNEGWWGINVEPGVYNASFYVKGNGAAMNGTLSGVSASIRSNLTDDVWAEQTIEMTAEQNISYYSWTQFETQLTVTESAPDSNNSFYVTFNATEVAGNVYYFSLISLFPETYKGRPNGIRRDLGQIVEDLGTRFFRFPGGNNLEGESIDQRWKWNATLGPLINRAGRVGNWGYYNTDGLGLMEYLEFCEDVGMEPVLGLYAGYSLDNYGAGETSVPEDDMQWVLDDIMNELEFITGDTSTSWGAYRAELGHPEPFDLNYVEIGNEDWFSTTYPYRFPFIYNGIKAVYPDLTIISSTFNERDNNISIPAGAIWDTHHYQTPSFFLQDFDFYDNWQEESNNTDVGVFIGEYSVFQIDTPSGEVNFSRPADVHIEYPQLLSIIGEGVYLLGAERNPSVVKMTGYAPSFANLNNVNWDPDLVYFTANYNETVLSTSYYLQQLFAHFHGTETLTITNSEGDFNPLWWSASIDGAANEVYVKVINSGNSSVPLTVNMGASYASLNGTQLTAKSLESQNDREGHAVVPLPIEDLPAADGEGFTWNVTAYSVNVLQINLS
jgi:alpha-L-arabinofuranosidase